MNIITIDKPRKQFKELYDNSAYTCTGCADPEEFAKGYTKYLKELGIGNVSTFYTFTGKQMNENYKLKGTTRYPDDLKFLAFKIDGLDCGKLAIFKLRMEDRWFDDIVDNNKRNANRSCVITM